MTTPPADYLRGFVEGFAQVLAATVDGLSWDDTLTYPDGATGIYIASMPDTPDRVAVLTPYVVSHDAAMQDSQLGLQIRLRSAGTDVRDLWGLSDAISTQLLGLWPFTLPTGIRVTTLTYTSGTSLGREDSGRRRWTWADNWHARVWRPSPHRT